VFHAPAPDLFDFLRPLSIYGRVRHYKSGCGS
jgi:hypothetical protein